MKISKFVAAVSISAALPLLNFAPVLAADNATINNNSGEQIKTSTVASPPVKSSDDTTEHTTPPPIKDPDTKDTPAMKKRLDDLKADFKTKLDDTTKKHIIEKCKPAQTVVDGTQNADKSNSTKRTDIYAKITTDINDLITKLKANGQDATALQAAETAFELKVATFNNDMTTYRQTMADLHALDCSTDPTAFEAALTTARTQREKVRADALDIRTFVTTTLKTAFTGIKAKLPKPDTTADDKSKNQSTGGNQ